jgi:hypothetical protein
VEAVGESPTVGSCRQRLRVRYVVGGGLSQDVLESRVAAATLDTTARRRSGAAGDEATRPSLLSASYIPRAATASETTALMPPPPKKHVHRKYSTAWLIEACNVKGKPQYNGESQAAWVLRYKRNIAPAGWLRTLESGNEGKGQLKETERTKALSLFLAMGSKNSPLLGHAWGVTKTTIQNIRRKALQSGEMVTARKARSDKGKNVFNSEKKRKQVFTDQHAFSKQHRVKTKDGVLSKKEVNEAWATASPGAKARAADLSAQWLQFSAYLETEVKNALLHTAGSTSWEAIARMVGGSGGQVQPVAVNTIRTFVMELPDSQYTKTVLMPFLTVGNKQLRYAWARQFWVFWESAKTFHASVQVALVHMDAKSGFGLLLCVET